MIDLSHWDYETDFTAEQVAALIIGVDPGEARTERARMAPVLRRLEKAYRAALDKCYSRYIPFLLPSERPAYAGEELSGQLIAELEKLGPHTPDRDVILDRVDAARDGFLDDTFPRPNVASWLTATGMKSVYGFDAPSLLTQSRRGVQWPWGEHHTVALGYLEIAARQWWSTFDPAQPDTAPTNKEVSDWLMNEHGISAKLASSITSILRADGLKPGRR
jgi:hypothetical protein